MQKKPARKLPKDFAVFILTHGRPDTVYTHATLRRSGYTGPIYLLVDDLDKTRKQYEKTYGKEVVIFDKKAIAKTFDIADNRPDLGSVVYARNASFEVARRLKLKYFIQLDDDYRTFGYRFDAKLNYCWAGMRNMDEVLAHLLDFFIKSKAHSIAIAQGGDFIGGSDNPMAQRVQLLRKSMNSFICSTERPFKFLGRMNDDVNTYIRHGVTGALFFTTNQVSLAQLATQSNPGGLTEMYLDAGTYVKSFYTVMFQPSSVRVGIIRGQKSSRLHHLVDWKCTVPKILPESLRKK